MFEILVRTAAAVTLTLALVGPVAAQDGSGAKTIEPNRLVPPDADMPSGTNTGTEKVGVGESHAASREGKPTQDTETSSETTAGSASGPGGDSTSDGEPAPKRLKTEP